MSAETVFASDILEGPKGTDMLAIWEDEPFNEQSYLASDRWLSLEKCR